MDALNAEALRERTPLVERAAQAGGEPRARALDHGRGDEIGRDPAETNDAPAYRGRCATHQFFRFWKPRLQPGEEERLLCKGKKFRLY